MKWDRFTGRQGRMLAIVLAACVAWTPLAGQDTESAELQERVERLERELEQLREREKRKDPAAPSRPRPADGESVSDQDRIDILAEEVERLRLGVVGSKKYESVHGFSPAASEIYHTEQGVSIGGYGEILYQDNKSFYQADQVNVRRFILYFGYRFNDWILLNAELEYENAGFDRENVITEIDQANQTATQTVINEGEVFVEFAYVDFEFADWARLSLGLNLVPIGITNYLHEPTTFYSAQRPQTETVIIPSTWREIGLILHGDLLGDLLTYRTGVMNGGRAIDMTSETWIRGARTKGSRARAEGIAYVFNLDFKYNSVWLGGSVYSGQYGQNEVPEADETVRIPGISGSSTNTPTDLTTLALFSSEVERRSLAPVTVNLAELHGQYQWGPLRLRALFARGWMNEDDTRAVNRQTGRNIGKVVEGGFAEAGYNVLSHFDTSHQLVLFVRNEYVNTQKHTVERQAGGDEDFGDSLCRVLGNCLTTTQLAQGNRDLGIIENSNAEARGPLGSAVTPGAPDPVNDRRIITYGLAYFPHPNVVLKLDYEQWSSRSRSDGDLERFRPLNNKVDRLNFSLGFIF